MVEFQLQSVVMVANVAQLFCEYRVRALLQILLWEINYIRNLIFGKTWALIDALPAHAPMAPPDAPMLLMPRPLPRPRPARVRF